MAENVIEAISAVMDELPGIGKGGRASEKQGGYAYRGIDQITKAAQPLFAKHGVVFVPRVLSWETREFTIGDRPWTDERLMVEYLVFGPGGAEDHIKIGPIAAIGRDNSDKGCNKALTQAFKYALLQTLCIADSKDDADGTTHERDPIPPGTDTSGQLTDKQRSMIYRLLDERVLPDDKQPPVVDQLSKREASMWIDTLQSLPEVEKAERRGGDNADVYGMKLPEIKAELESLGVTGVSGTKAQLTNALIEAREYAALPPTTDVF